MAENKQEKKTIQVGDQKYLVDDILGLSAAQLNNYFNFARDKGGYDDEGIASLRNYINKRLDNIKAGQGFNADGSFDGDVVENVTMKVKKPGGFGKKEITQGNRDWANNYFYHLVKNLKPYQETEDKPSATTWDISKHGLNAYLTGQGLDAKHVFENYDLKDPNNPDAARSFTQRRELLKKHLGGYRDWLKSKGFDFTKNDNEWDDNYLTDFESFVNNFDTLDNNALTTALRKYGAGNYTTAFTSDKWDLTKTNEALASERESEQKRKESEEEIKKYRQYIDNTYANFQALEDNNFGGTYFTSKGDGFFDMSDSEYESWLNTHTDDKDAYMKNLQERYYANPFDVSTAGEYLPLAGRFGALKDVTIDGRTFKYDPNTIDRTKNRFVAFDPESGEIRHAFIGDIEAEKEALKRKWRIENGYINPASSYYAEGGIISMQTGGSFNLAQAVNRDLEERNKARAKETGNSEEVQKARDRVVSNGDDSFTSEQASIASPDAGFTGADKARLASIGADIASIFLDPVTGVAVGLGSTLTNFGADIADDGFQWEDVKNLGINAGFDLLGAIPIFGDAVGTGAKIARTALKWAPRMMTALAAFQGVKNFDGMMNAWGKLTSGDEEQKLTVQDWRNIAQSISLVTGGVRATRNKVAQNKMKQAAKIEDVVGVNVRNKDTGEINQILVDGNTAKNIRAAQGDKAKIEQELSGLEMFKDKFGEAGTLEVNTQKSGFQKPWEKITNADGSTSRQLRGIRGEGRADVQDVYDFSRVPSQGVSKGLRIPGVSDVLNNWHQRAVQALSGTHTPINARGAYASADIDAEVQRLQGDVDVQIEAMRNAMTRRTNRTREISQQLTPERTRLNELRTALGTAPDVATLQTNKSQQETALTTLEQNIANRRQLLEQAQANLDRLLGKKHVAKRNQRAHKAAIQRARGSVQGHTTTLQGLEHSKTAGTNALNTINEQLQMHADLPVVTANVQKLEGILNNLRRTNHTNAYQRLQSLLTDYQTNHSNIGGRNLDWDMSTILQNAGIRNAFKEGGSIDKNKINKFLKYAKG